MLLEMSKIRAAEALYSSRGILEISSMMMHDVGGDCVILISHESGRQLTDRGS
jgi:hypothetical protein